jgi:uncharacterized protein YgfB (UPF0149 family)
MNEPAPGHAELEFTLSRLQLGVSASDLHGSLTGYLCAGGSATATTWSQALELDAPSEDWSDDEIFVRLYRSCRAQLDDDELGFEPLLPDDDAPLVQRGDALVEWCRGFLGGVGLAGATNGRELSEDAREIIGDFGTIAATRFDYDGDDGDETALVEVLEFVRIGVLLLHAEINQVPRRGNAAVPASRRVH